jgi:hypothetical protein
VANANLTFVSSIQRGMDAGLARPDQIPAGLTEERVTLAVALDFQGGQISHTNLKLVGPGDIVGLDPRAIVRTYPRRDDNDAEFGHFAMVEFDQADLPWRYTPAKPAGSIPGLTDKLRPWLTLIVLAEGTELLDTDLTPSSLTQKLPIVSVHLKHLPTQSELWAWSHLQANDAITGDAALASAIGGAPGLVVARVMSPRVLKPQTSYHAFLVPTFERGRRVVTGEPLTGIDALTPAWVRPPADNDPALEDVVRLPVYYDWRFQTGTAGSFEQLVSALLPGILPATIGRRQMAVHLPGLNLPDPAAGPVFVAGALQSLAALTAPAGPALSSAWINGLKAFVDVSEMPAVDEDGTQRTVKVVGPPLYGRWYAAQGTLVVPPANTPPPWFFALNSDPSNRVPAALGTEVVQREQQSLMEAAWLQIDQLRSANYERKVLQTARQVFGRYMVRHINTGFIETQLTLTSLLHGRILVANDTTVLARLATSALGRSFFSPQWRRFTSPRGLLGRRLGLPRLPAGQAPNIFSRINDGTVQLAPTPVFPEGGIGPDVVWGPAVGGNLTDKEITDLGAKLGKDGQVLWGLVLFWVGRKLLIDLKGQYWWLLQKLIRLGFSLIRLANDPQLVREKLREALRTDALQPAQVTTAPVAPSFAIKTGVRFTIPSSLPADGGLLPLPGDHDSPDAAVFRPAVAALVAYLRRPRIQPTVTKVDLPGALQAIMNGIAPALSLVESQTARFTFDPNAWKAQDPLEPIQSAPQIDRPMYEPLRDISNDWILPGVGDVPNNTVSLVVSNQAFIEAYMAGLNHEMTRELVWNEFPVDQRGTYFRQFWDARAFVPSPDNTHTPDELKDIQPISTWPAAAQLGQNSPRPAVETPTDARVVLLVRGQLIKRYPNVIVYAATDPVRPDPPALPYKERHPVFQGFLGGDVAYYAFDLKLSEVNGAGSPWYFILQEQPAEPRFGVPDTIPTPPDTVPYARVPVEFSGLPTAARVALQGFRQPFRVAVKGSALTSPPTP